MDKQDKDKNKKINQILANISGAASAAADGVSDAVQSATQVVGEKYDSFKLTIELNRLHDEQMKLFTNIGRTLFLIKSGSVEGEDSPNQVEMLDAQKTVDNLLILADQKQQAIDLLSERLHKLSGAKVCAVCSKPCDPKDEFCSSCGAKLPSYK